MKAKDIPIIIFRELKEKMHCKAYYLEGEDSKKGKDSKYSVINLKEKGMIVLAEFIGYSMLILAYDTSIVDKSLDLDNDFLLIGGSNLTEQLIKESISKLHKSFQKTYTFVFYYSPGLCLNTKKMDVPIIKNVIDMINDILNIKDK